MTTEKLPTNEVGSQRLALGLLKSWEELGYGMFIHFGMSTFDGIEHSLGDKPSSFFAPDRLDVDQWVSVARDAGMKYAVLTAKHVSGHCLWPTKHNDYHVGTSSCRVDIVDEFVKACERRGVIPGLYYCTWDNHNRFGSYSQSFVPGNRAFTTQEYREFQMAQVEELLTQYGEIGEMWIDIPGNLGVDGRIKQYNQIATLQKETLVVMNASFTHGDTDRVKQVWPTDIFTIECGFPCSLTEKYGGHNPWVKIGLSDTEAKEHYIPAEVCNSIGNTWFYREDDMPRNEMDLLGSYLLTRGRGANFLLNVGPDTHGLIQDRYTDALMRLRRNIDRVGIL